MQSLLAYQLIRLNRRNPLQKLNRTYFCCTRWNRSTCCFSHFHCWYFMMSNREHIWHMKYQICMAWKAGLHGYHRRHEWVAATEIRFQFDVFFFFAAFRSMSIWLSVGIVCFWIAFEVFQSWEVGRWRRQNLQCIFKGNKLGRSPMVLCGCFVWRLCLQFSATRQHYVQPFRLSQLKTFLRWISQNG